MVQDFTRYYRYSHKWVQLFEGNEEMKHIQSPTYLKGYHNLLNALFMVERYDKFEPEFKRFIKLKDEMRIVNDQNSTSLWNLFYHIHNINKIYLTASYSEGVKSIELLEKILEDNTYNWDVNRVLVFYYRVACVYFGNDQWEKTIMYLNMIINQGFLNFRGDIQCFARILNLIAHFELGNDTLVSYQVKSMYRFLLKLEDLGEVQKEIFRFIRRIPSMTESGLIFEFKKLKATLLELRNDPYERRPFLYLDIISWLDTRIYGITVEQAIKANKGILDM